VGNTAEDRIGPDSRPRESDLDALRDKLLERLRSRSQEVEEAIVAAALNIEPAVSTDAEGHAGLRAAARETVELIADLIREGERWKSKLPPAVSSQVRRLARSGVTLDSVMRGYYATISLCFEFATTEISELPSDTLPYLIGIQSEHGDYLMSAVSAEYESELARLERSPGPRRLEERIHRLLDGDAAGVTGLDYDFESWNLGMVAVGPEVESAAQCLAERLGCRLLLLPRGAETAWIWLGANRPIAFAKLERALRNKVDGEMALAIGEPRRGIDGWRFTHREALVALEVMRRKPQTLVRCSDVVLLAAAMRDEELARILVDLYLSPLGSRKDGEVLRETLRSYFASRCNAASAAASLGVDRQTVRRRLRKVEERIDRKLDRCGMEIEMALQLEEYGRPDGRPPAG
jgi:hypothetical protein